MNKCTLVGRLTKDPEIRYSQGENATATARFSVAVNRRFKNAEGNYDADFINCVIWGKQAENLCKYCTKGSQIGVQGRIQTRNYQNNEGKTVYVTEENANNITFLSSKGNTNSAPVMPAVNQTGDINHVETNDFNEDPFKDFGSEVVLSDDDLPF